MRRSTLLSVDSYVPSRVVTNDDLARQMTTSDEWIVQRTGIKQRRYIERSGIGASDLAVPACQGALSRAGLAPEQIDAVVFATLSPDYTFPGSGCLLVDKLGMHGKPAIDVRNQCTGFLYGLSVADAWVRAGVYEHVLVVGSEVHSTGLDFSDAGRDVTVLFGDGAGAAVVGPARDEQHGILSVVLHADGRFARELWVEAPASAYDPRISAELMAEGRHYPRMNGKQVFRHATERMPEVVHEALGRAGIGIEQVDLLVPHQANMRINQLVAERLGLPQDKVVHNIEEYGNTTAATIPMALDRAFREGRIHEGSVVVFAAFGSGFTWGGAVVRF